MSFLKKVHFSFHFFLIFKGSSLYSHRSFFNRQHSHIAFRKFIQIYFLSWFCLRAKKSREINFSRTFLKILPHCAYLNVTYSMHTCSRSNSKIVSTSCLHKYCCVALSCAPDRAKMPVICCPNPSKVLLLHRRENCCLKLRAGPMIRRPKEPRKRDLCVVLSAPPTICIV